MTASVNPIRLFCQACGLSPSIHDVFPHRCGNAVPPALSRDDARPSPPAGSLEPVDDLRDHLLCRRIDTTALSFPRSPFASTHSFLRYRSLLYAHGFAIAHGVSEDRFVEIVQRLDERVRAVGGGGFEVTPCRRHPDLEDAILPTGEVWAKDETCNVSGSHKGRHLFGILLHLEIAAELSEARSLSVRPHSLRPKESSFPARDRPLVIASCGNAALAAAIVARAGNRELHVLVPADANPSVLRQIASLGASIEVCPRNPDLVGDPCMHRLYESIRNGEIPFTVQGQINGLALEGGLTLGYELVETMLKRGRPFDRIFVQVGGGALASSLCIALSEAVSLGAIDRMPKIHAVQTVGAHPLERAFGRLADLKRPPREALREAALNRPAFMWPWETPPVSRAHGILDDETYDWLSIAQGMLASGGSPVVVEEDDLLDAETLANGTKSTGAPVDATGAAALAGLMHLRRHNEIRPNESVAVLFTGRRRQEDTARLESPETL